MAPHSPAVKLHSRAGPPAAAAAMGVHRWSHPIAKGPPRKIRIVHVLAPEVIKTDVRHFRELVQRLTGKPKDAGGSSSSSSSWSAESAEAVESSSSYQQAAAGGSSSYQQTAVQTVAPAAAAAATVKAEEGVEEAEAEGRNDAFFQDLDEFLLGADHLSLL